MFSFASLSRDTRMTLMVLLAIVLLAIVVTVGVRLTAPAESPLEPSRALPTSTFTTLTGEELSFVDSEVPVTVIVGWASWCPSCVEQLEQAVLLSEQFPTSSVQVIAMNRSEPQQTMRRYLNSKVSSVANSKVIVTQDPNDTYFDLVKGYTAPEVIVYTQADGLVEQYHGYVSAADVARVVESLLSN